MRTRRTRNRFTTTLGRMAMLGLAASAIAGAGAAGAVHLVSSAADAPVRGPGHVTISTAGALLRGAPATTAPIVPFSSAAIDTPRLAPVPAPASGQGLAGGQHTTAGRTPQAGLGWGTTNWAGYVDTAGNAGSVSGEWSVPDVVPSQSSVYSATWLGIDGWNDNSLIQAGTEQDSANNTDHFDAW